MFSTGEYERIVTTTSSFTLRPDIQVKRSCCVVEHVATGNFIVDVHKETTKEIQGLLDELKQGIFKNKFFQGLVSNDSEICLTILPCKTLGESKSRLKLINQTTHPVYLDRTNYRKR